MTMVAVAVGYRLDVQDQYSDIASREAHDTRCLQEVANCEWSVGKARQKSIPLQRSCR